EAHAYVYAHMPHVGAVVHTHSPYATAWAARGEPIPCSITAMADEFGGDIPVGPFALIGSDAIGRGIVETLSGHRSPAVLMRLYGPETLEQVASQSRALAAVLDEAPDITPQVIWKPVLTSAADILRVCLEAGQDPDVVGVIAWMHTFSPAKMWIAGLDALRTPL